MKRISIFLLVFSLVINCFSQDGCLTIKKDDFTGSISKTTGIARMSWGMTRGMNMWLQKTDSSYYIFIKYNNGGKDFFCIKGTDFIMILNDNSRISLKAASDFKTEINVVSGINYYGLYSFYEIKKEQLEQINKIGILKARIYYGTSPTFSDEEFNQKKNDKIAELIKCLLYN